MQPLFSPTENQKLQVTPALQEFTSKMRMVTFKLTLHKPAPSRRCGKMDCKVKNGELDVDPGSEGSKGWLTSKHQKPAQSQRHNTHLWDLVVELMQWVHQQALACTEVIHTSVHLGPNCKSKLFSCQTLTITTRKYFISPRAIHKWNQAHL